MKYEHNNVRKYRFKEDYLFNNDILNVGIEKTDSWTATKDTMVYGSAQVNSEENKREYITVLLSPIGFKAGGAYSVPATVLEEFDDGRF